MKWAVIFLLALTLRVTYIVALAPKEMPSDSNSFDTIAWNLVTHGRYAGQDLNPTARRPPSYPLFVALIYKVAGHSTRAVQIAQAFLGAGSVLLLMLLAKRLTGDARVVLWTGLGAAVYPFLIYYDAQMLTESFMIFFLLLSLLAFYAWRACPGCSGLAILAGLSFSSLCLAKTVFIPLFVAILIVESILSMRQVDQVTRWVRLGVMGISFLLPILVWGVRNQRQFGAFVLDTHGGETSLETVVFYEECKKGTFQQYYKAHPELHAPADLNEVEANRFYAQMTKQFLKNNPGKFARQVLGNIKNFWRFYPRQDLEFKEGRQKITIASLLTEPFLLIVGWVGVFLTLRRWTDFYPLYGVIGLLGTVHALLTAQMRYRLPLMPFFILFSALAIRHWQMTRSGITA